MKRAGAAIAILAAAMCASIVLAGTPVPPEFSRVRAAWRPSDAQLLDRNNDPIHELRIDSHGRRLAWTGLEEISPALLTAVTISEDRRFWSHRGVDVIALCGAFARSLRAGRPRGASTITMQLASLLDPSLGSASSRRSLVQKVRQMRAAIVLERRWSKRQILEAYLNLVTYRGELQGIGAASRVMFGKMPHGIDGSEAVVLAALIRAPNAARAAVSRRAEALARAIAPDSISGQAVAAAVARSFSNRPGAFVRVSLAPHLAQRMVNAGTGTAHCTLDREVQRFAAESLRRHVKEVHDRRVDDGAVLVVENPTGEVWAYVGGAGEISNAPYFDAVRARRQPGSTLKPFLYALALSEHLLTAASLIEDTPLEIPGQRGIYRPLDYDRQFRGLVSMRTALASSLNIPAVRTADLVGVEKFADNLRRLGFSGLSEDGDYYGAALALGSADVSLWELANGYRTLANGGEYSPLWLTNGGENHAKRQKVYSQAAVFVISDVLADRASRSVTFGLENSLATRYWSAVKTGTSKDMRDNWCVGYINRFTVGVWVGNSSGAPMRDVSGITGAAPVWLEVMNYLHDRFGSSEVARPFEIVTHQVRFPKSIEPPRQELFIRETVPSSPTSPLDDVTTRIMSPAPGTTIAIDPDIPTAGQRVVFEARASSERSRWILDGRVLGPAGRIFLWPPAPGAHTLSIADQSGRLRDSIGFSVRGSQASAVAASDWTNRTDVGAEQADERIQQADERLQ